MCRTLKVSQKKKKTHQDDDESELILKIKSEFREMVHFFFLFWPSWGTKRKVYLANTIHLPLIARDLCDIVNDDGGLDWIGGGAPKK